ncbi:hypothetical protein AN639_06770 [Candidatus Epulonipiscium fishelsonii]|uniref:Uncharacterized protein n=1 Tax=Candidatus Epulonipiscium fishelsonii TaxID=77094 RepID=A0ACC8X7Y5_9FIRM|nr:hypothetical protein AN396_12215 [Epulopiscium sp. SCG-B11WGA-EpuloA1]ONI39031.1 hypothetical protein AN639_06770 [Epulopiscium sp. SCG-B05WGA-EpuloA1]
MPKVSIIVPVYNVAPYLDKSIRSILDQSLKDIEIILINDGSTDNSLDICKKYAKKDNRIRLVNKSNGGVSSARNIGLDIATGEYIGFVDPDDWIDKDMYLIMYKKITEHNCDICLCDHYITDGIKKYAIKNELYEKIYKKEELIKKIVIPKISPRYTIPYDNKKVAVVFCAILYNSKLLKQNNIKFNTNLVIGEDTIFNLNNMINAKTLVYTNNILYYYFKRMDSATHKYYSNNVMKQYYKIIQEFYISNNLNKIDNREDTIELLYYLSVWNNKLNNKDYSFIDKYKISKNIKINSKVKKTIKNLDVKNAPLDKKILFILLKFKCILGIDIYTKLQQHLKYNKYLRLIKQIISR